MTDAALVDGAATAAPAADPAATPATPLDAAASLIDTPAPTEPAANPEAPAALPEGAVQMPGKDATPEQWAEFYAKLGRPETPDAYELPLPDGDDGTFAKQVAPMLHKAGITGEQAKSLAADWNALVSEQAAAATQAENERITALDTKNRAEAETLKTEWGQAHDANLHQAKLAVAQFLPKEQAGDIIAAIESRVGYKATIQMLHAIGKGLAEHDAAGLGEKTGGESKSLAARLYPNMPA